jgi:hypothetical protein
MGYAAGVARSHLCASCGFELAGLRAPPDAHYALPVVVCPRCERAWVRRPHAGDATRRSALRLGRWGLELLARLGLLGAAVLGCGIALGALDRGLWFCLRGTPLPEIFSPEAAVARERFVGWFREDGRLIFASWAFAWGAAGLVCGMAFPHWRARWCVVGALAAVALLVVGPGVLGAAADFGAGQAFWASLAERLAFLGRSGYVFVFGAVGLALAIGLMPLGRRQALRRRARRGLGSRRLRRLRRRKRSSA